MQKKKDKLWINGYIFTTIKESSLGDNHNTSIMAHSKNTTSKEVFGRNTTNSGATIGTGSVLN